MSPDELRAKAAYVRFNAASPTRPLQQTLADACALMADAVEALAALIDRLEPKPEEGEPHA